MSRSNVHACAFGGFRRTPCLIESEVVPEMSETIAKQLRNTILDESNTISDDYFLFHIETF